MLYAFAEARDIKNTHEKRQLYKQGEDREANTLTRREANKIYYL
jgi:hypothetical protein